MQAGLTRRLVAGKNCCLHSTTGKTVFVPPFSDSYDPIPGIPIGSALTCWTNPDNVESLLIVCNEALFFGEKMPNALLCPNQMRANGVNVSGAPKQFEAALPHCVLVCDHDSEDVFIRISLNLVGVISCFNSNYPSKKDMESLQRVHLTDDNVWTLIPLSLQNRKRSSMTSLESD